MNADDEETLRDVVKYKIQVNEEMYAIKSQMQLQVEGIKTELQTEMQIIQSV